MEARISPVNRPPAERVVEEIAQVLQQAIAGYRFHPTEEELINYLKSKMTGCRETFCIIPTLENIYEINPWDLPAKFNEKSIIRSKDPEWWFICPQTQNQRITRKTPCGFSWNITGKPKDIKARNDGEKIGSKKTLVFIDGRRSKGTRSNWVMHEFHPHPDDMGFVLCYLKMKQEEKADIQEPYIQKVDLVHSLEEKVDEMSGTSNFVGEQADKICDIMDFDNPEEQLPFEEHHVQARQNQLNELIMKGSSSSTEMSSGSGITATNEWSRIEPWMSPLNHATFPNSELYNFYDLFSETEADIGVVQHVQFGETSCDNRWVKKNRRPVCDTLEGVVPLEEEKRFFEQKFNHPHDTEKIITECTSSEGAPAKAKAQAAEFKEKETPMIQPPKKKNDGETESNDVSPWETWNDSISPTRWTASTSCCCRNKSTIDPVLLARSFALVLLVYVIVDGICRISDGVNETMQHYVFFG
ncbi:uncharacterized protein LOC115746581 isoform X2 [Rhodamnia argentea]|uniref:Uncharacterized protein LOC115746581 isoform X2 n=1 Tax=Rhodamnia argentea TaxID=178133 RepID=A0A8B8PVH4_9MYRT|nr:uncharacterized protein LOC115746581 isoform X2 [Rhodamnia argentea]